MDGKKVYQIQINGITESVNAVEALNKQLDALEKRIKTLESSNVKVNTGGGSHSSSLSEEAAVQKEINKLKAEGEKLDAKIVAAQDEVYKKVDATKQLYKETIADQKALAAQERLTADAYSNTMQGMKNHLADLKAAINVTDLGDSDKIKQMTQEANELTNKLKQMEQAYGQFGRNVGNYASAADGFKGLAIQVGDTTKEFDNAKQALKELKKERDTLSTKKDMGLISEEEAKRLQDLIPTVAQLQSSIQDAGKPMDALMDSMQSFVAIMQSAKGISTFFGLDDSKVEESIQKLVALQNAMQGLQTIQKQLQTQEGIGKWLSKGNAAIDAFTKKLFGLDKATKTTNASLASTGTAGKTASVGIGTASVAANTATKSFSLATAAATALRVALSALGIGLVIAAISALVEGVSHLIDKQKEAKKFQEDLDNAVKDGQKEYAKTTAELTQLKDRLDSFNGSKKQEKKLVEELNSKYGTSIGQYKSVKEWKDALIKKGEAYAEVLKLEAQNQALLNLYTENYVKLMHAQDLAAKGPDFWDEAAEWLPWNWGGKSAQDKLNDTVNEIKAAGDTIFSTIEANNKKIAKLNKDYGLNDYAEQIDKNTKKTKNALEEAQKTLNQLELRLMNEGLNKKLRQLDEEERQTINKLKENGRKTGAEIQKIQRAYSALREKEIKEYLKNLEDSIRQSAQNIKNIQFDINIGDINNQIDELENKFEELSRNVPTINKLQSRGDLFMGSFDVDMLETTFKLRLNEAEKYYQGTIELLKKNIKEQSKLNEERINTQAQQDRDAEKARYNLQFDSLQKERDRVDKQIELYEKRKDKDEETLKKMKENRDELDKQMQDALNQHTKKMQQIREQSNNAIKKNELDTQKEITSTQEKYYDIQLSNYRDLLSKLNDEISRNPVTNSWGIVNIKETRKNYQEIVLAAQEAFLAIEKEKKNLKKDFDNGLISKEAFNATFNSLNDLEDEVIKGMNVTKEASKNLTADFIQSAQVYLNAAMDSFNQIMQAVWDYQDNEYEDEQERLDKENELLDKKLDEQQEIIERHKDAIESIEDELATSRGDRRQHLIDQLNAQIEAQRRAAAEEKKIQKEKEANEKKQDELERQRKISQYHRDKLQAIVNGALAVTYAAINKYPIPAIPLMALAASTTAAQLAIMSANKPYAKGGLLEGPSHKQGGIPVGNTGIEVEGKEYVIRKKSTAPNMDVLDYINRSERKLDLGDFIDFYSSKVRNSISTSSPRAKFADGGALPTLSNDYSFDDRLLSAFEDYSKRPVVVSVVDINNRQNAVKNVQVLAGLTD